MISSNYPEFTGSALNAAQFSVRNAEQRVHLSRRVFINAAGMVNENVIRFANFPRRLPAKRAHGRGKREHPDRRADRYVIICGKIR